MSNTMLKPFFFFAIVALCFAACTETDDIDEPTTSLFVTENVTVSGTTETFTQIEGSFDADYTLDNATNWLISGGVFVNSGVTLTIEAGTTVYAADDASIPFLAVSQGGKIDAQGTANAPIVMTTIKTLTGGGAAGDWGGVILNGYANLNIPEPAEGEGDTGPYGGNDDADNSGTMRYVRVEYAGKKLATDNELNGFSFNGVGSGTTLEYLQAYKCADDGFEFFGGTVSLKYAVAMGAGDDSFDWTFGWSGNGQFWLADQQGPEGDRGIEADNNGDDNAATPYSMPTLSNITLIGMNETEDTDGEANTGMRLRAGTKGHIYNAIVADFPNNGIRVSDDVTTANMVSGDLKVQSSIVANAGTSWKDCAEFENDATNASFPNSDALLNGYIGTVSNNATDPTTLDTWFDAANYIGAVQNGNDWLAGWTAQ